MVLKNSIQSCTITRRVMSNRLTTPFGERHRRTNKPRISSWIHVVPPASLTNRAYWFNSPSSRTSTHHKRVLQCSIHKTHRIIDLLRLICATAPLSIATRIQDILLLHPKNINHESNHRLHQTQRDLLYTIHPPSSITD